MKSRESVGFCLGCRCCGFQTYQESEEGMSGNAAARRSRPRVLSTIMLALQHRLFQFFLVVGKQNMNLAVSFVADSVNLRTQLLPRSFRVLIEQNLNLIVVLLKQRPELLPLFRSQLQIFGKVSKFLVNRLRRMDVLKPLTRGGRLCSIVLS